MEITEEDLELNSDEYDTNSNKKTINIIIFQKLMMFYLLIPLKIGISIWNIIEENKSDNYESIKEIESIIDIPKLIRNKDSKSIQMLTLQSITPDIDLNKIICNEEPINSNNTYMIYTKILSKSDETLGFLERNKHQKMSTLQIEYLKN